MTVDLARKSDFRTALTAALIGLLLGLGGFAQAQDGGWPGKDLLQGELPKQVLIEVLVADISHAEDEDYGVEQEYVNRGEGTVSLFNDLSRVSPSQPDYSSRDQSGDLASAISRFSLTERSDELFQGLDIFGRVLDVDSGQLFVTVQALAEQGKGEILSRPSIVAIDGQEARIETGQIVPFLTRQITGTHETIISDQKSTGVQLIVTPWVKQSDEGQYFVQLNVRPEVSFVSRRREEKGLLLPVVASRKTSTTVIVASGKTFIIGGLYRDNETRIRRGVPGLSSIPLLGSLFSSTSHSTLKSELIISITPTVLESGLPREKRETAPPPQIEPAAEPAEIEPLEEGSEGEGEAVPSPEEASAETPAATP